jgi:hypothetical protein
MVVAPDPNQLVSAWIALHKHGRKISERDEGFWAWEQLHELVQDDPEQAWLCLIDIWNRTSDDDVLGSLAAGPLEDLLTQHGPLFIDRIETTARKDPKLRKILAGVWKNAMPHPLWDRVRKAANIGTATQ